MQEERLRRARSWSERVRRQPLWRKGGREGWRERSGEKRDRQRDGKNRDKGTWRGGD